jgi:hypothetical protein
VVQNARKAGSVCKLNLDIGSISGVSVDAKHLNRFARKLRALDVVVLHGLILNFVRFSPEVNGCQTGNSAFYRVAVNGA